MHDHPDYSKCASYPDKYQTYREGFGRATDPLAGYGSHEGREPRGSFFTPKRETLTSPVTVATLQGIAANQYYCIDGFAFQIVLEK